jgi:hypothetical protein
MQETKDEITTTESALSLARERVDNQQKTIKVLQDSRKSAVSAIRKKIEDNEVSIQVTSETIDVLSENIIALKTSIEDRKSVLEDLEKAKELSNKKQSKHADLDATVGFFKQNDTCPQCEQGIPHAHKTRIIDQIQADFEENQKHIDDLTTALVKLEERLDKINVVQNLISDKNIEMSTANQTITLLNKMNREMLNEIETSNNNNTDIDGEKKKLKDMATEALALMNLKTELVDKRFYEEVANGLLKDTGIKTSIIREYLPTMNKLINKYLQAMDFYVSFELNETFNEVIRARYRDEFTYASFSEGEKMRIDLAILFTWRQIAKMKNSVNTNLLILDEIFDSSLDVAGTDYFLSLMNTFGDNTSVFVISHKGDQLFDKFRSVIKFEKKNDFSVIA